MLPGFWIGASGLNQHQKGLDVVSNNVANVNTVGYKGSRVFFEDIFSQTIKLGGAPDAEATSTVNPVQKGMGVQLGAIARNLKQGTFDFTGMDTDIGIQGPGFFVLRAPNDTENLGQSPALYYTRAGNFSIDANAGVTPADPNNVTAGPITLVSSEGYTLQGVNATLDATTGEYVLPTTTPTTLSDITFDPTAKLGPFATTQVTFGQNLDALSPLAIDPQTLSMSKLGVDHTIRIEFQKATAQGMYYFFRVTDPTADPTTGVFATQTDGITGQPIEGVVQLDSSGNVVGVFQKPASDTDDYLTTAEIASLSAWTNVDGSGNPIFTVGAAPLPPIVGETAITTTAPAAFNLAGSPDAGSLVLTDSTGGKTLVENVDYTLAGQTVTPLTAWPAGNYIASYTTNGGAVQVQGETVTVANANPTKSFIVANPPIQAGTVTVNGTRGGAALVEGTDFTVDVETGKITPLTFWDPATVTVDYTQADTRITVKHNVTGNPISFIDTSVPSGGTVSVMPRPDGDVQVGTSVSAFDSLGNEHSLTFSLERLSDNRWVWTATPTYRSVLGASDVVDNPQGGGTNADGITVLPNTLKLKPDGTYDITITVDEGTGPIEFKQLPPGSTFPSVSGSSNYFMVTDPTTGAIAFSRDIDTSNANLAIQTNYLSATTAGEGIIAFDLNGNYDTTAGNFGTQIITPIQFTPQGADPVSITADFNNVKQYRRKSDFTAMDVNGFSAGDLLDWEIDDTGRVVAKYSNGKVQYLAQVALARFPNPEGLHHRGETTFLVSNASGDPEVILAGSGDGAGTKIVPRALEQSNVDLSEELTNMILFQRAYQFNSRIITTEDELIQEAISIKR